MYFDFRFGSDALRLDTSVLDDVFQLCVAVLQLTPVGHPTNISVVTLCLLLMAALSWSFMYFYGLVSVLFRLLPSPYVH